jgi:hypothetical protein
MLTGEIPLDAPARQAGGVLRSPRAVNPKVSQTVSDAVMAGLEMDYKKRPQKIEDFHSLLEVKGKAASPQQVALPQPIQQPAAQAAVAPSNIKGKIGKVFGAILGAFWWPIGFNVAFLGIPAGGLIIAALFTALIALSISYVIMRVFFSLSGAKMNFYEEIIALKAVRIVVIIGILAEVLMGIVEGAKWGDGIARKGKSISLSSFLLGFLSGGTFGLILLLISRFGYPQTIWRILFFGWKYAILFIIFLSFLVAIFSTLICSIIYWLWTWKTGTPPRKKETIITFILILVGVGMVLIILHFVPTSFHEKWFYILTKWRFIYTGVKNLLINYWHTAFSFFVRK